MAKSKKQFKKLLNQLQEDQYLEIDDAIINVVNKKTKNVVVSIDIFSDYEKDNPFEEEYETIEGNVLVTDTVDESNTEYKPMIVINREITDTIKEPAIDEATGEPMYDRDGNALYNVFEDNRVEEVVIDTAQVITENIFIPSGIVDNTNVIPRTKTEIEPGSWYYIKLQLEEAFKINELKKAISEFEAVAPIVLNQPVKTQEDTVEIEYYTLKQVLEIHRRAIFDSPNTFWQNGDILNIGSYGDGKYEFKITIQPGGEIIDPEPVTDIKEPIMIYDRNGNPIYILNPENMKMYDRNGDEIFNIKTEEGKEVTRTFAIIVTGEHIGVEYESGWGLVEVDDTVRGTQKVSYYYRTTVEFLAALEYDGEDKTHKQIVDNIREKFESFSIDGDRYVEYPEDGEDDYEKEYDESGEKYKGLIHLPKDEQGKYYRYDWGYRFLKGDIKQVRHGGIFEKFTQEDINQELIKAREEAIKNNIDVKEIENAYAKINVGAYKSWSNLTSNDAKNLWADYMGKMAITTDSVYRTNKIPHNEKFHFYRVQTAYVKCMVKILINLGYADWSSSPDKGKKGQGYTHDKNYIIETDLETMASIELEEVKDVLDETINNTKELIQKLDQCLYGYSKYIVDPFNGFETEYQDVRNLFSSLDTFANRYWGDYKQFKFQSIYGNNTSIDGVILPIKVRGKNNEIITRIIAARTEWSYDRGMFLYYIMMYQAKLFYAIALKTVIDIIKQIQEYLSFDQAEYDKFLKNKAFTTKVKKGQETNNVMITDDKGKKYSRKSNSFRNANKKLKKLFKKHFLTYYRLVHDLFDLDDYITDKFMLRFNKTYKVQIREYEAVPEKFIITDKKAINYYQSDRSHDHGREEED